MRKFQKYLAFILSLTLVLSYSIPSTNVIAASTTHPEKDLHIKHTSENSWEYIQEIDGEVYKIIEEVNPRTDEVTSYIKKQNENGEFILEKTHFTKPIENGVKVETLQKGKKTTEEIKTEEVEIPNSVANDIGIMADPSNPLTPWLHSYTYTNSLNFSAITVGIVAAALSSYFGMSKNASFVFGAATTIVSAYIPTVYTKKVRYYKNEKGTTILAGIKDYRYVYEYSNFTGLIKSNIEVDCASGYYCG